MCGKRTNERKLNPNSLNELKLKHHSNQFIGCGQNRKPFSINSLTGTRICMVRVTRLACLGVLLFQYIVVLAPRTQGRPIQ